MKIMAMPDTGYDDLRIHDGPHYPLDSLINDVLGDYFITGNKAYWEQERDIHIKAGHIELCSFWLPNFQRGEVWTDSQKIKFVENLFLGHNMGSIMITNSCSHPLYDKLIIDGQQRLTAIRDFALGKIKIFNDVSYDDMNNERVILPASYEKKTSVIGLLRRTMVPSIRIERCENKMDALIYLYNTFNFSGTAHTIEDKI